MEGSEKWDGMLAVEDAMKKCHELEINWWKDASSEATTGACGLTLLIR